MQPSVEHSAEAYVRGDSRGFVLCNPVRDTVIHGVLVATLVPVAILILGALLLSAPDFAARSTTVLVLAGAAVATAAGISMLAGLVTVATARRRSRRSEVLLDLEARQVITPRGEAVDWSTVSAVFVHKPTPLLKWWAVSLERAGDEPLLLLGHLAPSRGPAIAALCRFVATHLGVEARIPDAVTRPTVLSMAPTTAGMLCYLPVQGVFLAASAIFAITSRDAFVRFCAIQSLLQFALAVLLLVPILACGGALAALDDVVPTAVTVALLVAALGLFQVWRVAARAYAAYQAYRGRAWVMPWLGFVVRRWLPPDEGEDRAADPSS